jgi:BirA family biotin operon repressor/biotin-[acetyl-CoA-carboxylase] ligase
MTTDRNRDLLDPSEILRRLGQSMFTRNLVFHKSLDSTNNLAKELASSGAPEGTIVLAEEQTQGRGRMGREWFSPGYVNLLLSMLLRPTLHPDQIFILTMITALASIEAIREISGLSPLIKWPNDLYVGRRKLAGILTEFSQGKTAIEHAIIGLGLNVNWIPEEKKEFSNPVTSILKETGLEVSRNDLLSAILKLFEEYYRDVLLGRFDQFYKRWNDHSLIIGREVEVELPKEKVYGKAIRIDHNGALVIRDRRGEEQKIFSGDVTVRF